MTVRLTRRPLSVARASAWLTEGSDGGIAIFVGRVRPDRTPRGTVTALEYETDLRPATRILGEIEAEAIQRLGATRTVVWHRYGRLSVGSPSVIVGAAAPHREAAFAAARYLIDELKRRAPIWKSDSVRPGRRPRRRPSRRRRRSTD